MFPSSCRVATAIDFAVRTPRATIWTLTLFLLASICLVDAATAEPIPEDWRDRVILRDSREGFDQYVLRGGDQYDDLVVHATDGTSETDVTVTWSSPDGLDIYTRIWRDGQVLTQLSAQDSLYVDADTDPLVSHLYTVEFVSLDGDWALSVGFDAGYKGLLAPANLVATDYTDLSQVYLTWEDRSNVEDGYLIYRDGAVIDSIAADATSYEDLTATPLQVYEYGVAAFLEDGAVTSLVGAVSTSDATDVTVVGSYAYLADGASGTQVLDISDPSNPTIVDTIDPAGGSAIGVKTFSDFRLVVAAGSAGVQEVSIFDLGNPSVWQTVDTPGNARDIAFGAVDPSLGVPGFTFVADGIPGVQVLYSGKGFYIEFAVDTPGEAKGVRRAGNYLFVADGSTGLQVIDVADPNNPASVNVVASLALGGDAQRIEIEGDLAYIANGTSMEIVDIADPLVPTLVGSLAAPSSLTAGSPTITGVAVRGSRAYLSANGGGAVRVADVSNPTYPVYIDEITSPSLANGVLSFGDYLYVCAGSSGLSIFDVADGATSSWTLDDGVEGTIEPATNIAATYGLYLDKTVITWEDNSENETGFRIERPGLSVDVGPDVTSYEDNDGAILGAEQTYTVSTLDPDGIPQLSGSAVGIFGEETMVPVSDLYVSWLNEDLQFVYDDKVLLTWTDAPHEDSYVIFRGLPKEEPEVLVVLDANTTSYEDFQAVEDVEYSYCVVAQSDLGGTSVGACGGGQRPAILAPSQVSATDGDHEAQTTITWTNRSEKTAYFKVLRDGFPFQTVAATVTSAEDHLGEPGTVYNYEVQAVTALGVGRGAADLGSRVLHPPTNVSAEDGVAENRVLITWEDNSTAEEGYRVYRLNGGQEPPQYVGQRAANRTSLSDTNGEPGVEHTYQVVTYDAHGTSLPTEDAGIRNLIPPSNVSATDGTSETEVLITWEDNSGAETGYIVRRNGSQIGGVQPENSTSYSDPSGALGETFTYSVETADAYGSSIAIEDEGTRTLTPPSAVVASDVYQDRVVLTWVDESNLNDSIWLTRNGQLLDLIPDGTTSFVDDISLQDDVEYEYCVAAYNFDLEIISNFICDTGIAPTATSFGTNQGWVTSVTASDGTYEDRARIEWTHTDPPSLAGFKIYRDGLLIETVEETVTSYNDFDAVAGAIHDYTVLAFESGSLIGYESDLGWAPPDGAINGRVTTRTGAAVEGVEVCLSPAPNQALIFDGDLGRVMAENVTARPNNDFTIEFWMKSSDSPRTTLYSYYATQDDIRIEAAGGAFFVTVGGSTSGAINVSAKNGQWHHIAVTWDRSSGGLSIYKDGVFAGGGSVPSGETVNNDGTVVLGQDQDSEGGGFGAGEAYQGILDEVRVWNYLRSQTEIADHMGSSLAGDESGLLQYWPLDSGSGFGAADLTLDGDDGRIEGGASWTSESAPIASCAVSDVEGNYELAGLRYGASTTFEVRPNSAGRAFDPEFKTITLDPESPIQNEVVFHDITAFSVSGFVSIDGTCGQEGVPIYLDGVLAGATLSDGSFSVAAQPGEHLLESKLDGQTFSPASYELDVMGNLAQQNFVNETRFRLTGSIAGGCDASIGTWRFDVTTEDNCYQTTIEADGSYELELPPGKFLVAVDGNVVPPADPTPLDVADILQFFQNQGTFTVDMGQGDQVLDLLYKAPLTMSVTGFPADCPLPFHDPETGATSVPAPLISQLQSVPLTISVYEDYGNGNTCPVDSGTVTIYDEIIDLGDSPQVVAVVDGVASYTTIGNTPNITPGRIDAQGNDRSFQKPITFSAAVDGQEPVLQTHWALVTGDKPRTGTFVSATTEEIPILILRDPMGDGSTAYMEQGESFTYTVDKMAMASLSGSAETAIKAGFEFDAGTLFFTTGSDVELETTYGFELGVSATVAGAMEFTVTTTELFQTSAEQVFVGPAADLYLGVAMNVLFAKTDVLAVDPTTCEIEKSQTIRFGADSNEPFETVYLYTDSHIEGIVIPQLEEFAATDSLNANIWNGYAENWQDHLDLNDSLRVMALENPIENRSFSAGAEFAYEQTTIDTDTFAWDVNVYSEDTRSTQLEFEVAGSGGTTTFAASWRMEASLGNSEVSEETVTVGYNLADDDPGDFFSIDIGNDPLYGTPVFGLPGGGGGRSSCPWEAGTQPRDSIAVAVVPGEIPAIAANETGEFILSITNWSPSGDAREYQVRAIQTSNPGGAVIRVNGSILTEFVSFFINPLETQVATLTVDRGPSRFNYQDLQVQVVAPCEYELWEAGGTLAVADTASFSITFDSPCSDITMVQPEDGWTFNTATSAATDDTVSVLLKGFELEISETDSIESVGAQYRLLPTDSWTDIGTIAAADVPVYPDGHLLEGQPKSVTLGWDVSGINDGQYEIRPFTKCDVGRVYGVGAVGRIDRMAPELFGSPRPADLVYSLGDQISFRFNEAIDCATVNGLSVLLEVEEPGDNTPVEIQATCSGTGVVIQAVNPTLALLEGETLTATVTTAIEDLVGNPLASNETWTFDVIQSEFSWRDANLVEDVAYRSGGAVTATLVNGTDLDTNFQLSDVATWLTPDIGEGVLVSGKNLEIHFTVSETLSVGSYVDTLYAQAPDTLNPVTSAELEIRVDVACVPPTWGSVASTYENTMTAVIELYADGFPLTSPDDLIGAFVGNELRGVASPVEVPGIGYFAFMNIFSNRTTGENVRFRIFDSEECRLYSSADNFLAFEADRRHGTPETPIVLNALDATPMSVQEVELHEGWSWFSLNLVDGLDMTIVNILGDLNPEAGDEIKSRTQYARYDETLGWDEGDLEELSVTQSYAIDLSEAGAILHEGDPAAADIPIPILDGWNWVGYPPAAAQEINVALQNVTAVDGDLIKSQAGFAEYVESLDSWVGTLTSMEPGVGYKLFVDDAISTNGGWLIYPAPLPGPALVASNTGASSLHPEGESEAALAGGENRPDWQLRIGHQFNMTITAQVEVNGHEMSEAGGLLGAFVDGELRGVGEIEYVYSLDGYYVFMMVQSNLADGDDVEFRYYDYGNDTVLDVDESLSFAADEAIGSLRSPFLFRAFGDAPDEPGLDPVPTSFYLAQPYPNPVQTGNATLSWALPSTERVVVRIFDVRGREVMNVIDETQEPGWYSHELDLHGLSQGTYFYRMDAGEFGQSRKIVILK